MPEEAEDPVPFPRFRRPNGDLVLFGDRYRSYETIAPPWNIGDVPIAGMTVAERLAKRRDVDLEIALLDECVGPDTSYQLFLSDQLARALQKGDQNVSRAAAETDMLLALQQQLLRRIQTKRTKGYLLGRGRTMADHTCLAR